MSEDDPEATPHTDILTNFPDISEIRQTARDTNTTLVTYSQIADEALYIWVVKPTGELAFRSVAFEGADDSGFTFNPIASIDGPLFRSAADEPELTALVSNVRTTINVESTNGATVPEILKALHQVLIRPIADLLPTDPEAKVVFAPQGNLFLVSFPALQDEEFSHHHTLDRGTGD